MSDARMFSSTKQLHVTCSEEGEECASGEFFAELLCIPELLADQLSNVHVSVEMARLLSMQNPGCGATLHLDPECCSKFWYGDAENSNFRGSRFSSRHKNNKSVTGAKKMIVYKVCNKLGCTHKDPTKWKQETHKEYVQKKWREGRKEDLVDLNCLHCGGLLEEEPRK